MKGYFKIIIRYTKFLFLISDVIFLNGSYFLALFIRYERIDFPYQESYFKILMLANILWILLIGFFDVHKIVRYEPVEKSLARTIKMVSVHFALLLLISYVIDLRETSRLVLLFYFGIMMFVSLIFKTTVLAVLKKIRSKGINLKVVAIVGYNENATSLYDFLTFDVSAGYKVLGYFTDESKDVTGDAVISGKLEEIHEELKKGVIQEVYIAVTTTNASRVKRIIRDCDRRGIRVKLIPDFQKYTASKFVEINYYKQVPVLSLRNEPLSAPLNKILKRTFDIVFAIGVVFGILPWLYPIVAIMIKLDSKGPVVFKQLRSGIDGSVFTCYKFRTMYQNEHSDKIGTQKDDPRITKVGKFLRRSRIDELLQFVNVLIGDMSVVGPRPHMVIHTQIYSELIDEFMIRFYIRPGITGWAQTVGYLNANEKLKEMRDKVKNDIWYIENWSFLLDMKIIFNTTINIFRKEEAERV